MIGLRFIHVISSFVILIFALPLFGAKIEKNSTESGRGFILLTPDKPKKKAPLVIMLHGCKINAEEFLELTGIESYVDKKGLVVAAPSQSRLNNLDGCWNWFMQTNQERGNSYSELEYVLETIEAAKQKVDIDPNKIFVVGLSSGGGLAVNLWACYPEVFRGAGIHSGVPYRVAGMLDAADVLSGGPSLSNEILRQRYQECATGVTPLKGKRRFISIQGDEDTRVVGKNTDALEYQVSGCSEFISPSVKTVHPRGKYSYKLKSVNTADLDFASLRVEKLAHKWSGSKSKNRFADPNGPDATALILKHFGL